MHWTSWDIEDDIIRNLSGNWRITFYFEGQDAHLVDYIDYH